MKRLLAVALAAAALVAAPDARSDTPIHRYAGVDRYDTAAAVAELLHPDGAATAVVATGTSYPDALAAGVAAAALDAPLLLASSAHVPTDALRALGASQVVIIGGTAAVPAAVADAIVDATGATVERVAGDDRYETAAAVADLVAPDASTSIRAPGTSFPTALVAAVHAARLGARLILDADLDADELDVDGRKVRGEPGALNLDLLDSFPPEGVDAVVTTISTFADALSASALAGALGSPVLFTEASSATQAALDTLAFYGADDLLVVGGSGAVSDVVLQQLFGYVPLPPEVGPDAEISIAYDVFVRLNDERAARWIAPLAWDASLAAEAASWAREMSSRGLRHDALGRNVGENIHELIGRCDAGTCVLPTSGRLHGDWMGAADNRDNLLEPGYAIGGVGVFCGPDGRLWAVARFGLGYGTLSAGGSAPAPLARGDEGGFDCSGAHS